MEVLRRRRISAQLPRVEASRNVLFPEGTTLKSIALKYNDFKNKAL
jgi:hypothetical protein